MEAGRAKAVVKEYFERLLNGRDLSVCDELLSPDYVDHDAPPGTPPGPGSTRAYVAAFLGAYPDMCILIEDAVAEGGKVAVRASWRGTHKDSGAAFRQRGIVILRLDAQGRLAERWSVYSP